MKTTVQKTIKTSDFKEAITVDVEDVFNEILNTHREINPYDKLKEPELYKKYAKKIKQKLFTPAIAYKKGSSRRKEINIESYNGLLFFDYDGEKNPHIDREELFKILKDDDYIHFMSRSTSEYGLRIFVKSNNTNFNHHQFYWESFHEYFLNKYKLNKLDPVGQYGRICYISGDPNAYYNKKSVFWTKHKQIVNYETINIKCDGTKLEYIEPEDLIKYQHSKTGDFEKVNIPKIDLRRNKISSIVYQGKRHLSLFSYCRDLLYLNPTANYKTLEREALSFSYNFKPQLPIREVKNFVENIFNDFINNELKMKFFKRKYILSPTNEDYIKYHLTPEQKATWEKYKDINLIKKWKHQDSIDKFHNTPQKIKDIEDFIINSQYQLTNNAIAKGVGYSLSSIKRILNENTFLKQLKDIENNKKTKLNVKRTRKSTKYQKSFENIKKIEDFLINTRKRKNLRQHIANNLELTLTRVHQYFREYPHLLEIEKNRELEIKTKSLNDLLPHEIDLTKEINFFKRILKKLRTKYIITNANLIYKTYEQNNSVNRVFWFNVTISGQSISFITDNRKELRNNYNKFNLSKDHVEFFRLSILLLNELKFLKDNKYIEI